MIKHPPYKIAYYTKAEDGTLGECIKGFENKVDCVEFLTDLLDNDIPVKSLMYFDTTI